MNNGTLRLVEDVLGCKWTVQVLEALAAGHRRPGRLRRAVEGIAMKVLNERLTKLTQHGIVERQVVSHMPPHVEYHLTPKGRQLARLVRQIQLFSSRWEEAPAVGRGIRGRDG